MSRRVKYSVVPGLVLLVVCLLLAHHFAFLGGAPVPVPRSREPEKEADPEKMAEYLQPSTSSPYRVKGMYVGKPFWVDEERSRETTVRAKLIELGATLHDGKVVDAAGRELYFYPVADYRHRHDPWPPQKTKEDIEELEKKYRVIRMYDPPSKD